MIEILMVIMVFGYIYYLRNYADLRSKSEKEEQLLKDGIKLFAENQIPSAFEFFNQRIKSNPSSAVAYLYRARCYKSTEDFRSAMNDLNTGLSYDDSLLGLHLEKGKLYYRDEMYDAALASLNKAVFYAGELDAESYYWRGMTKQHLNQEEEAQKDFEKETQIRSAMKIEIAVEKLANKSFVDRRLLANCILVFCTSAFLIVVIKKADSIHLPYLMAVFSAISIGFVEPHKGWILAILQGIMVLTGYYLFTKLPESGGKAELENFSLYGSVALTFASSFLGAFLKRAIMQG